MLQKDAYQRVPQKPSKRMHYNRFSILQGGKIRKKYAANFRKNAFKRKNMHCKKTLVEHLRFPSARKSVLQEMCTKKSGKLNLIFFCARKIFKRPKFLPNGKIKK